jgi:hypothetical protein
MACGGGHLGFPIGIKNRKFVMVLYNLKVFCSDMKFKMAATAGLSLTLDQNVSKCFISETTWTVETKLPRNDH